MGEGEVDVSEVGEELRVGGVLLLVEDGADAEEMRRVNGIGRWRWEFGEIRIRNVSALEEGVEFREISEGLVSCRDHESVILAFTTRTFFFYKGREREREAKGSGQVGSAVQIRVDFQDRPDFIDMG